MATEKALDGKPYAGIPHVRFDEGEVAPAAKPRRGSLLYKRLVIAAFAATFSISTFATGYTWKAVSNVFDGMFTDPAHWDPTREIYPGQPDAEESELGNNALFDFSGDGLAPNIYWPDGVITNFAGMTLRTTKDTVITVYGTNTTLVLPKPTNGTRGWGYGFKAIVGTSMDSNLNNFDYSWGPLTAEPGVFSNFVIRTRNPASMRKLEFVQGLFDFHNSGYQLFFQESVANAENRKGTKDAIIEVGTNATVNIDSNLDAYCPSTNNIFRIFGTANVEQSIRIPGQRQNVGYDSPVKREILFDVKKGGTFTYGLTAGHSLELGRNPGTGQYGSSTSVVSRVSADGGTIVQKVGAYSTKSAGPGRHVLEFKNGSTGSFAGMVSLGTVNMSTGVVSIANSTVSFANLLTLGGSSAAAVTGGAHGEFSATDSTVSFTNSLCLNNGSVTLGNGADIALASASRIYGVSTYGGTRSFAADGASVSVGTATDPIAGFDTATIGDGGLSITANGDIELSQSFSGAGTLTLSGSGAKTVSGDIACAKAVVSGGGATFTGGVTAEVVATNGATVAFSGNSTQLAPLGGLRLGDRSARTLGRLVMQPNETVWVNGPVDLQCLRVAISGAASAGDTFAVACMQGAGETVREEWAKLNIVSGLPANTSWEVSEEEIEGGGKKLVATLCSTAPVTVALASGAETHATNITYGLGAELDVVPETNAKLYFEGNMGYGALVKAGGGAAYLSGANSFVAGFVANGGLLSFVTGASVGDTWESKPSVLRDGTLEFLGETTLVNPIEINASSGNNGLVIIKNEVDVTMPIPSVTQGAILKRGRGRLTFEVDSDTNWSGLKKGSGTPALGEQLVFDDANGTSPATSAAYGVVNVAEGELVFRGTGATKPTISFGTSSLDNQTFIGVASTPEPANPTQPGLVLDNVDYKLVTGFSGGYYDMYVSRWLTADTASFMTAPYLYITNGASLMLDTLCMCYRSNDNQVHANLLLDNGTITACYELHLSENFYAKQNHNTTNNIVLRNGSRLFASYDKGRLHLTGTSSRFYVDGSTIARNASGAPLGMFFSDRPGSGVDMTFRNGSYFGCYMIGMSGASSPQSGQHPNYPIHLTFDDSEWYLGAGNLTLPSSNMNVRVTVVGGGLKLNPPDGSTWRLYTRIDGSAGIVKGGAGTLLVDRQFKYHEYVEADPVTLAYEGRTTVTGGTLKIVSGACAHHLYGLGGGATLDLDGVEVSGADIEAVGDGTIVNASIRGLTLRPTYENGAFAQVTFGSGTTLAGRVLVDFGRTPDNPLPKHIPNPVVARWTGAKPDVSSWRGVNGGITGRGYAFAATDGGDIVATSVGPGVIIFIR